MRGRGLTPQRAAKLASLPSRSGLSPAATSRAPAVSVPTPNRATRLGAAFGTRRSRWWSSSVIWSSSPVRTGALHPHAYEGAVAAHPRQQRLMRQVTVGERGGAHHATEVIDHGGVMDVFVRVDAARLPTGRHQRRSPGQPDDAREYPRMADSDHPCHKKPPVNADDGSTRAMRSGDASTPSTMWALMLRTGAG